MDTPIGLTPEQAAAVDALSAEEFTAWLAGELAWDVGEASNLSVQRGVRLGGPRIAYGVIVDYEAYARDVEGHYFGCGREHNLRAQIRRITGSDGRPRFYVSTEHAGKYDSLDFEDEEQVRFLIQTRGWQKVPPRPETACHPLDPSSG